MRRIPGEDQTRAAAAAAVLALPLIEAFEQPVLACDAAGRAVLANAAARRFWGLAAEQFPNPLPQPLERALAGEEVIGEELRLARADGESRLVEISAKPLRGPRGGLLGAMMAVRELSSGVDPVAAAEPETALEAQLRNRAADIELLEEVSQLLAELQDPDEAADMICTVAAGATGAIVVLLWELVGGELVMRRCEGGFATDAVDDLSARARAGAAQSVSDASAVHETPDTAVAEGELGSMWHEPLTSGGRLIGVLSILWIGVLDDLERPGLLIRSLARHAATALDRSDLLRRLSAAARTDPLTGLANRRVWQEGVERELARAERDGEPISMALIDIDHFKRYNDRLGHPAGDRLLVDAARAWSEQLRATDVLARVGGEEFAVILPQCGLDHACAVAERLRASIPHGQTCSVGVVVWDGHASAPELYAAADGALYRAKHDGRNRVKVGKFAPH